MNRRTPKSVDRQPPSSWLTFFCSCFALVFSFIILLQSLDSVKRFDEEITISDDLTSASHVAFTTESSPFHHPAGPAPAPQEFPVSDEKKSNDNVDDDWNKWGNDLLHEVRLSHHEAKLLFHHLRLSIANRPGISLFILHHSWKSFLI